MTASFTSSLTIGPSEQSIPRTALVFVLLVPKEEKNAHIAALQRLAQLFSEASHLAGLRGAQCNASLFAELVRIDDTLSAANLDRRSA